MTGGTRPDRAAPVGSPGAGGATPAEVAAAVAAHRPLDAQEALARERILGALASLPAPLDRQGGPEHVTGSAVVVGRRGVLLHRHRRLGRWLQPGGHLEPGELPAAAALREAWEETGVPLAHPGGRPRLIHLDVHPAGSHLHLDLRYLLLGEDQDPAPPPGESQEVAWFGWAAAWELADEGLRGALRAARAAVAGLAPWAASNPGPLR